MAFHWFSGPGQPARSLRDIRGRIRYTYWCCFRWGMILGLHRLGESWIVMKFCFGDSIARVVITRLWQHICTWLVLVKAKFSMFSPWSCWMIPNYTGNWRMGGGWGAKVTFQVGGIEIYVTVSKKLLKIIYRIGIVIMTIVISAFSG